MRRGEKDGHGIGSEYLLMSALSASNFGVMSQEPARKSNCRGVDFGLMKGRASVCV